MKYPIWWSQEIHLSHATDLRLGAEFFNQDLARRIVLTFSQAMDGPPSEGRGHASLNVWLTPEQAARLYESLNVALASVVEVAS